MKLTRKVFTDLAIYMIFFGILVGVVFPFFTYFIGVSYDVVSSPIFVVSCLSAGIIVGLVNFIISKFIVGRRLDILYNRMKFVNSNSTLAKNIDIEECKDKCFIPVDSDDIIGDTSNEFNELIGNFLSSLRSESSLRQFTEIYTNELDLNQLTKLALISLIDYTSSSAGTFLISKEGKIEVAYNHLITDASELVANDIVLQVFLSNERKIFNVNENISVEMGLISFIPKTILYEPVSYNNNVLGVIILASTDTLNTEIINGLSTFTHGLSLGINNALIHSRMESLAVKDELTKVYNRRYGIQKLTELFNLSDREKSCAGILMFDIDHFKHVNDTYGHLAGDYILRETCQIFTSNLRASDTLIRYGGEEFLIIFDNVTLQRLQEITEKLRGIIENHTFNFEGTTIKITISFGGKVIPNSEIKTVDKLISSIDDNLYQAKTDGRNRAVIK